MLKTAKTVGKIGNVKIIEGINGKHSLPEEAHTSHAYIKLKADGTFHEMRIYDKEHYLVKEIAYHKELKLDPSGKLVLHIHEYNRDDFKNRKPRLLTKDEFKKYKKYFRGVKYD